MNNDLNYYADIIGIISGLMSIVGISGILGWSIFRKGKSPLANTILQIFAYSIKIFLCIILLGALLLLLQLPWMIVVDSTGGTSSTQGEWIDGVGYVPVPFFSYLFSYGNHLGTILIGLFAIPFYILCCACLFTWSLKPLKNFLKIFKGLAND